jgi:exosome complex component MTR3
MQSEVESQIVIDPTAIEQKYATGGIVCAYMASLNEVTQLTEVGDMEYNKVVEAIDLCVDGCTKVSQMMRKVLTDTINKTNE